MKYSGGAETDIFESCHGLGGTRQVARQHVAKITINTAGTMHDNSDGEAMKKRLVFGRLLSLSASYCQGSGIAATGLLIALISSYLCSYVHRLHKLY